MLLQLTGIFVILLTSTTSISAVSVDSRTFFTCYDSQGWCKSDCSLPCFSVDRCNGSFLPMYTCPSVGLLVLVAVAIVLILLLLICLISCCCCYCPCCPCARSRERRKRKEILLATDVRHYERGAYANDGYGNYPTARIVEVTRAPIHDDNDKPASSTTQGTKKHRQTVDIVHMRQREFDDSDIINGFEQTRVWNTETGRRRHREPLPVHSLEYEESYRNDHHDYPIVPEPDYPTDNPRVPRAVLASGVRRHNDNATSLYAVRGTQTSAASMDNLDGSEGRDDTASKRLSI